MDEFKFDNVTRKDNILYMAYYFPQYHIAPENRIQLATENILYTDFDYVKKAPRSFTPLEYYNCSNQEIYDKQDEYANKYKIGVFIFYHYWLDNKMVLNLPVDLFMNKKRKTKFMMCWDNESGYLGQQLYNSPEEHAYQMIRYFKNENYLTDKYGYKPFTIYLTDDLGKKLDMDYVSKFKKFLELHDIKISIGIHYQKGKNKFYIPNEYDFCCEFAPLMEDHAYSGSKEAGYKLNRQNSHFKDYWQSILTSWDSRPRISSQRTTHNVNIDYNNPDGCVSVEEFKKQVEKVKNNIVPNNKDNIITIFAFNEWAEGAVLEESVEFGTQFIDCL
jgi:hypothetical protein